MLVGYHLNQRLTLIARQHVTMVPIVPGSPIPIPSPIAILSAWLSPFGLSGATIELLGCITCIVLVMSIMTGRVFVTVSNYQLANSILDVNGGSAKALIESEYSQAIP
jgi:hypothetical protein